MPEKRGFILFGSPHQSGATARLVQAFLKAFPEETEWTMVEAYHQKIAPCLGCGFCEHKEGCVNSDFDPVSYTHLDVYKRQPRWCRRTFSRAPDKKIHPRWPLVRSIPPEGESRSHKDGILRPYGGFHQRLETVPRESARRSAVRSSAAPGFLARSEKLECRYARKTEGTPSCNGFHFLSFLQR